MTSAKIYASDTFSRPNGPLNGSQAETGQTWTTVSVSRADAEP